MLHYTNGEKRYILHPRDLNVGDVVVSDFEASIKCGNALPLSKIPLGTEVHNVEFRVCAGKFDKVLIRVKSPVKGVFYYAMLQKYRLKSYYGF